MFMSTCICIHSPDDFPFPYLFLQTILGETHEEEDEILPRKDYEVRN